MAEQNKKIEQLWREIKKKHILVKEIINNEDENETEAKEKI